MQLVPTEFWVQDRVLLSDTWHGADSLHYQAPLSGTSGVSGQNSGGLRPPGGGGDERRQSRAERLQNGQRGTACIGRTYGMGMAVCMEKRGGGLTPTCEQSNVSGDPAGPQKEGIKLLRKFQVRRKFVSEFDDPMQRKSAPTEGVWTVSSLNHWVLTLGTTGARKHFPPTLNEGGGGLGPGRKRGCCVKRCSFYSVTSAGGGVPQRLSEHGTGGGGGRVGCRIQLQLVAEAAGYSSMAEATQDGDRLW